MRLFFLDRSSILMLVISSCILWTAAPGFGQLLCDNHATVGNSYTDVPQSMPEVPSQSGNPKIALGLNFGLPLVLPDDDFDQNDNAITLGAELLYGRQVAIGFGFNYGEFREHESILTDESGPEPIGTFQPKVKTQFYAVLFKYSLRPVSESTRFSPYGKLSLGALKRTYDFDLERVDNSDDKTRFSFSVDFGIEIFVKSPVSLTVSLNYSNTGKAGMNQDFASSFDAIKTYGAVQAGTNFRF